MDLSVKRRLRTIQLCMLENVLQHLSISLWCVLLIPFVIILSSLHCHFHPDRQVQPLKSPATPADHCTINHFNTFIHLRVLQFTLNYCAAVLTAAKELSLTRGYLATGKITAPFYLYVSVALITLRKILACLVSKPLGWQRTFDLQSTSHREIHYL